jgi:hypothetical protein
VEWLGKTVILFLVKNSVVKKQVWEMHCHDVTASSFVTIGWRRNLRTFSCSHHKTYSSMQKWLFGLLGWILCERRACWRMPSSGMLRHVALVRTNVSEECNASIIKVTRICELGTSLAITSNRCVLRNNTMWDMKH